MATATITWFKKNEKSKFYLKKRNGIGMIREGSSSAVTYVLRFPTSAECCLFSNILDINKIGYFGLAQTNRIVDAIRRNFRSGLWTKCQIWHVADSSDGCSRWHQCYPITYWNIKTKTKCIAFHFRLTYCIGIGPSNGIYDNRINFVELPWLFCVCYLDVS